MRARGEISPRAAVEAHAELGDPRALGPLSRAPADDHWEVRVVAAGLRPLVDALGDDLWREREASLEALAELADG